MPPLVTADRATKHARLVTLLDQTGANAIQLTRPETLSWYFDGCRTAVPFGGQPVFSAVIHRDGLAQVTALENEIDRLTEEEIGGAEFISIPWFHNPLTWDDPRVLRDIDVTADLRRLRASLLPAERARYRELGADVAAAMTAVLTVAHPAMTEHRLAGDLAAAVLATGAAVSVILVAGESRAGVQHPLPTQAVLGNRTMAVVSAVRFGLHISATRWIRFGGTEGSTESALREVEADIIEATIPGRTLGSVLNDIGAIYATHGFGTGERPAWRQHHQGGPTGYLGRDPKVAPGQNIAISAGGAFAWNPWVPGSKIEDTVIIDEDSVEILSNDPSWPTINVRGLARPLTLDLG